MKEIDYSRFSQDYLDAYVEAVRCWLAFVTYKGDRRSRTYRLLESQSDEARDFLWVTPSGSNLPNFMVVSSLYYDEGIVDADEMLSVIFGV